jgi:hypothetical protein
VLVGLGIMRDLGRFDATLVGTIPLAIDVEESDLDVACQVADAPELEALLRRRHGARPGFALRRRPADAAVVACFAHGGETIEVFGQDRAVARQAGFRHMVVEARLLALAGDLLRAEVVRRKRAGQKTEPAFAAALGLSGDPYERLLDLFDAGDDLLAELVRGAPRGS